MFTDDRRCEVFRKLREQDTRAFAHLLTPKVFTQAAQQAGLRIGNSALNLTNLVWLGVNSAWHSSRNFADVLALTLKILQDAGTWSAPVPVPKRRANRPAVPSTTPEAATPPMSQRKRLSRLESTCLGASGST